jgi:Tfp pilus assembly protein PilN
MSTINLVPSDYLRRRSQHRANMLCFLLLAMVMAAIGGAAIVTANSSGHTRRISQRINLQYADAAKLIDEMHQLEGQKRTMLAKAELSASLMERLPRSSVLASLVDALPDGASLISLAVDTAASKAAEPPGKAKTPGAGKGGRAAPAEATVVSMTLNGLASTDVEVARFIANLAQNKLTEQVELVYSQELKTKAGTARSFQLTVRLKPNADAMDVVEWMRQKRMAKDAANSATEPERVAPVAMKG